MPMHHPHLLKPDSACNPEPFSVATCNDDPAQQLARCLIEPAFCGPLTCNVPMLIQPTQVLALGSVQEPERSLTASVRLLEQLDLLQSLGTVQHSLWANRELKNNSGGSSFSSFSATTF